MNAATPLGAWGRSVISLEYTRQTLPLVTATPLAAAGQGQCHQEDTVGGHRL